ncbi:Pkinase-domain-containing protein [Pholiota conissans]|uniref:non-specific serine/threonine protein kinase n=1 Tax=Pholiota conissans TaxID=109636 RepID=A0A9P5YZS1_9AGAR|nr:Pkinase-domain-containing protein [Pholiota conissans]
MAPATNPHLSASLQIPSMDSNPGPSRQHNYPGPSPQSAGPASNSRPISVAAHTTAAASQNPPPASAASRRQRASHSVLSPSNNQQQGSSSHDDNTPSFTDVFAHPAAVAYTAAHPRRTIPKFGPYLLLQTLGEGEFGKVKLGLHSQWGEEVAVKLIRRGNVDTSVRLSKVEREIEVLKTLKHPNIVRLYDVIETDKYIGIILEYASGGELFDHILAHRYLRERDAAKLFSQLISGVWYIHQKKIVHRDLKLENLLLDRHRNVIITDFGFANRFEHRSDDLMQTSCGSPCYAAPELVISEGLYVGSAVDIWSCGVILYAMLAGYLPFDDDPANPDGDNINLLYKYIVSTPLSFPEYISAEARDLLSMMLVPDPARRTSLDGVMRHPWLSVYHNVRTDGVPNAFGKTVEDLEMAAMDQHQQKRLAYSRQIRQAAAANGSLSPSRTQSHRPEHGAVPPSASRSRSTQPEYLYDSSVDQSMASPGPATPQPSHSTSRKAYGSPSALGLSEDDPFAGPGGAVSANPSASPSSKVDAAATLSPNSQSPKGHKSNSSGGGSAFRHTIQVEYDDPSKASKRSDDKRRERSGSQSQNKEAAPAQRQQVQPQPNHQGAAPVVTAPNTPVPKERRPSQSGGPKPLPPSPPTATVAPSAPSAYRSPSTRSHRPAEPTSGRQPAAETPTVSVSSPPPTPSGAASQESSDKEKESGSQNSASSFKHGHKKGKSSLDRIGLSKIFGSNFGANGTATTPTSSTTPVTVNSEPAVHLTTSNGSTTPVPPEERGSATSVLLSPVASEKQPATKSRRNTLTVMVEPFSRSIRNRKGRMTSTPSTADGSSAATAPLPKQVPSVSPLAKNAPLPPTPSVVPPDTAFSPTHEFGDANGLQASSTKARKVMQWFRTKSKGRDSIGFGAEKDEPSSKEQEGCTPTQSRYKKGFSTSTSTVNQATTPASAKHFNTNNNAANNATNEATLSPAPVKLVVTTPTSAVSRPMPSSFTGGHGHPQRTASTATESSAVSSGFVARFRNSVTVGGSHGQGHHHATPEKPVHPWAQLRVHHGAVDQTTITTRPPPEVMAHVKKVLQDMGVEAQLESEYKFRCVRVKKRKGTVGPGAVAGAAAGGTGLAAVTMVGSAASNGVDKRGLPLPSPSSFSSTGGMLRGLLMRRQSSQVSTQSHGPSSSQPSLAFDDESSVVVSEPLVINEAAYGDPTRDAGDEVRFSVELTRLDRLHDTFSLDIRRLKGNLRSYKYLYDTLRDRADLSASQA